MVTAHTTCMHIILHTVIFSLFCICNTFFLVIPNRKKDCTCTARDCVATVCVWEFFSCLYTYWVCPYECGRHRWLVEKHSYMSGHSSADQMHTGTHCDCACMCPVSHQMTGHNIWAHVAIVLVCVWSYFCITRHIWARQI